MSNKELTKEESLELITGMIEKAKSNIAKGSSFYFLLWGWVVLFANLGHYMIALYDWYEHPYVVWLLMIPAGIVSMIYGARQERNAKVKSHIDKLYSMIWLAVFIGILIILVFMDNVNYNLNAIILSFAGIGTFISGFALRFNPLMYGGVALWIASIVAFNLNPLDQYLVAAIAVFAGYLIPGYLLRKAESSAV